MRSLLCGLLLLSPVVTLVACNRTPETDKHEAAAEASRTQGTDKPDGDGHGTDNPGTGDDDEEPLLLLAEPDNTENDLPPPEGAADNSRCHVCHMNYDQEKLATTHARNEVGCETCHGASDAHCSDEDNITPPDIMYAVDRVNPACLECHQELSEEHEPVLAGISEEKYCTECHEFSGHRLGYRTRQWHKTTGKLIMSDGVRMAIDAVPEQK